MKKILLLATLVLGMVSCMKDQSFDANVGGEADVLLSVALPSDITRAMDNDSSKGAIGNISLAQYDIRYILEVFDANDDLAKRVEKYEDTETSTTFELRLIPGRHYSFVVWADFVERNADGDVTMEHYNVADLRNIEIIGAQNAMDESRDAYTGIFRTSDNGGQPFSSSSQISFELKRPFAKLRVVTNDIDEIDSYSSLVGATIEYRAQTYQKYDALTKQSSQLATVTKSVDYTSDAYLYDGEPTADGEQTLFADYILGTQSGTVQFIMTIEDSVQALPEVNFNTAIPVERNYLTTIYGPILTDFNRATVEIKYAFENEGNFEDAPYYQVAVTNAYEYLVAYYEGREMVALNDIVVTQADVDAYWATRSAAAIHPVLNLNGNTITFVNDTNTPLITVADGSSFTVSGGSIVVVGDGVGIENNGTLNIASSEIEAEDGTAIVNNGEANIEGSTLNDGAVENYGKTNVNDSDVNDGAIENSDDAILGTYVYNAEELQAAIAAAEVGLNNEVGFGADIEGNITIVQKAGINLIINGRGYKFDGAITVNGAGRSTGTETLTFQNINFETAGSDFTFINAPSKINNVYNYSHNVTVENCTFKGNHTVGCIAFTGTYKLVVKNCDATNVHSILQAQSVDNTVLVDGVTVKGSKNGLAFGNTAYPTLKNSVIEAEAYGVRADGNASRGNLVIENTTINANVPVVVRKVTTNGYNIALSDNCTLTKGGIYDVVFTQGADDATYVAPATTWSISGADNYIVYPRDVVANGLFKEDNAYVVMNAEGLVALSGMNIKSGEIVTLGADIDLAGVEFNGLNAFNPETPNTFDGKGYTVSNWTYEGGAADMGFIRNWAGPVMNVKFENCNLKTAGRSAVVAAKIYGNIENVSVNNCSIVDSYWACGIIAGLYNAGSVSNCTVTNSSVKSNGGTAAIVGVFNEEGGERGLNNCSVSNTTINNTGVYGKDYTGGALVGMFNSGATFTIKGCTVSNNTLEGGYVYEKYPADESVTIIEE